MAEAIAISLSAKLGVALSRSAAMGFSSLFGVRSDMAAANQDLVLLRAFLQYADSRCGTDALAAAWVEQVRDAAFDLEEVADECCYLSSSGHGLARGFFLNVRAWQSLSRRLRKARERLCLLTAAKERYGIRPPDGPAPHIVTITSKSLAESAHFFEKEDVVGFAAQEAQLLEWVVGDNSNPQRTVVAVCGMSGVGKTTLVTRVYKEVLATSSGHFDCAAWVGVSQVFALDDLLKKILKELCRDDAPYDGASSSRNDTGAGADYRSLLEAVRRNLGERRYLVVLDDVWDAQLWDKHLRLAFLDEANGSRVVITTRSREVAKAATAERTMMLDPLPRHHAWTLFCKVAFKGVPGRTCPGHLEELAYNMLRRCGGLPLAIVSVGNLLALKERTEFAWRNARDSLVWDSSSDLGIGEAASVLNLSIDDLPHHLKKCFLNCSIYPEGLWIKRKVLIRRWVAQGFVQDKPGHCTAEDVADDHLDQLVQRSLMQPVVRNEFGRAKRCLIHDLFRELIIQRSRQEERLCLFVNCRVSVECNDRIRHLAIDRCERVDCQNVQQMSTIRSFNAFGSELDASSLSRFRHLTELNLWFIEIKRLPHSVTSLHNLRYLGIRSTLIEELPKELGKLQKLQVLDAKLSRVQRLPSSIAQLKSLRHLIVLKRETTDFLKPYPRTAVQVPAVGGLENLTGLQTLKYVQAHTKMVRSLARLDQMRSLDLSGVKMNLIDDLSMSISRMRCLLSLGLGIEPGADAVLDLESISAPPLKLQKLVLAGRLAKGKLPSWTCFLTSLVQLRLCGSQIAQDSLLLLGELPRLGNLSLIRAYRERSMIFAEGSFPKLCKLTLEDLSCLNHIGFQEGCLAHLRDLVLGNCTELTETPEGMEKLMCIENLELFGMPTEFVNKLRGQNGDAGYQNPANSEFQAPNLLRFVRFVKAKRTSQGHSTIIVNVCTNSNTSLESHRSGPCWRWSSRSLG